MKWFSMVEILERGCKIRDGESLFLTIGKILLTLSVYLHDLISPQISWGPGPKLHAS